MEIQNAGVALFAPIERCDTLCALFVLRAWHDEVHCLVGKERHVGLARVELGLLERLPAVDRHELMDRRLVLGGDLRARLAQAMSRAVWQASLDAAVVEQFPKLPTLNGVP